MAAYRAFVVDSGTADLSPVFAILWPVSPDGQGREYWDMNSVCKFSSVLQLPSASSGSTPSIGNQKVQILP